MCGKYVDLSDSYKSLNEALRHAGIHNHARVKIEYVDSEDLTREQRRQPRPASTRSSSPAASASAASRARSSPRSTRARRRSPTSASASACRSRRSRCARHKAGLARRQQHRVRPETPHPVIALIDEWQDRDGSIQKRDAQSDLGGDDAPRRAELRREGRNARAPDLRQRRSPSAIATATRPTSTTSIASPRPGW